MSDEKINELVQELLGKQMLESEEETAMTVYEFYTQGFVPKIKNNSLPFFSSSNSRFCSLHLSLSFYVRVVAQPAHLKELQDQLDQAKNQLEAIKVEERTLQNIKQQSATIDKM